MKIIGGVLVLFVATNWVLHIILSERGVPRQQDGRFFLMNHGVILRELSSTEFLQQQAYQVRLLSSGSIPFSSIALGWLIIAHRATTSRGPTARDFSWVEASDQFDRHFRYALLDRTFDYDLRDRNFGHAPPPAKTSRTAGLVALFIYVSCVVIILTKQPLLNLFCVVPITTLATMALRSRTREFPNRPWDTRLGYLSIVPNFILSRVWADCVRQFAYAALYVGFADAAYGRVWVIESREVPAHLSNGGILHTRAWAALFLLDFLLISCGLIGLMFMADQIGRLSAIGAPVLSREGAIESPAEEAH